MATSKNTTPSRHAQLSALLAFAKDAGYTGHTDKLENVLGQWAPAGANSQVRADNVKHAKAIWEWMQPGKEYTNEDIREGVPGLPVTGTRGKVEPSKVNAILNVGIVEGMFTKEVKGRVGFYKRVEVDASN